MRIGAFGTVALLSLALVACGADDRRLGGGRPGAAPEPSVQGNAVAMSGAVEGQLRIDRPPSCSPTSVALFGTIAGKTYGLTVLAPFASSPGGQNIDLPAPASVGAAIKLNGLRTGPWLADASGGSGHITVGPLTVGVDRLMGSFDADLVGGDGSHVHAAGTWQCTTPVQATPST